jgi:uncharacterized protein YggE
MVPCPASPLQCLTPKGTKTAWPRPPTQNRRRVVDAGVNQVNGISFGLKNARGLEDAARLAAVKALKAKADLYASATGYRGVRLLSLSEGGGSPEPRPLAMMSMAKMGADAGSTPVSGGELTVRIEVNGDYALVP